MDIEQENKGKYYLKHKRQKTTNYNKVPLSDSALKVIDPMREINGNSSTQGIFKGLKYSGYNNTLLQNWVNRAGISKKITPIVAEILSLQYNTISTKTLVHL